LKASLPRLMVVDFSKRSIKHVSLGGHQSQPACRTRCCSSCVVDSPVLLSLPGNPSLNYTEEWPPNIGLKSSIYIRIQQLAYLMVLFTHRFTRIPKINQIALRTVSKIKLETFKKLHAVSLLSDTLTASDIIQASTRSFSGSIFSEPIRQADADFNPARYIHFTRFFLGLPPATTIGGSQLQAEFDYPVQKCLATHGGASSFLDAAANHASSKCPATFQARQQKHQALERVIVTAAQQAGLTARVEPDTHSLLLGEFSKVDCRRVFPKAEGSKSRFQSLQSGV
jgi:hypothetical protein